MTKTVADIEKKIGIMDETEEAHKGLDRKFWVFAPLALTAVVCCAFLVVRRRLGENKHI
jgi:hypothetical protein